MKLPTFEEWYNAESDLLCDVKVKLKNEEGFQLIRGCKLSYSFYGSNRLMAFKGIYQVKDYSWVDYIVAFDDIRWGNSPN